MDRNRIEDLWARFVLENPMTPEEKGELLAALEADPPLRAELMGDERLDGVLQALGRSAEDAKIFAERFAHRVIAERDKTRFATALRSRLEGKVPGPAVAPAVPRTKRAAADADRPARRSTRRWARIAGGGGDRRYLFPILMAAGVLFGIVVLFSLSSSGPSRPEPGNGESARREREKAQRESVARKEAGKRKAEKDHAQAENARKEAEERLARLREEEKRAEEAQRSAVGAQEGELKKKADEAFAEVARKRKEEEDRLALLRAEEEAAKEAVAKVSTEPKSQEKPATQAAVAKVGRVEGEAYWVVKGEKKAAATGQEIGAGQGIETGEANSIVETMYSDESRLQMGPGTLVREFKAEGGKRLTVERGTVRAEVAKQPKGEPMVFATPHGEAKVVGTTLRIVVDPDPKKGMRLDVGEGKVQLKNLAGKTVLVESGHYAVAAVGVELVSKPLPIDEILLLPRQGRIVVMGVSEWRVVKDDKASTGYALEAPMEAVKNTLLRISQGKVTDFVEFTFLADAGKDYHVWIRGSCAGIQDDSHDSVSLQLPGHRFEKPYKPLLPSDVYDFQGYWQRPGYWWIGGNADGLSGGLEMDVPPACIRLPKSGRQVLRLYANAPPMRVDVIWLSATQKTRPDNQSTGPTIYRK